MTIRNTITAGALFALLGIAAAGQALAGDADVNDLDVVAQGVVQQDEQARLADYEVDEGEILVDADDVANDVKIDTAQEIN